MEALDEGAAVYLKNIRTLELAREELHKDLDEMYAAIREHLRNAWASSDSAETWKPLIFRDSKSGKGPPRLVVGWRKQSFCLYFEDPRREKTPMHYSLVLRISNGLRKELTTEQKAAIIGIGKRHDCNYEWGSKKLCHEKIPMVVDDPDQTAKELIELGVRHLACIAEIEDVVLSRVKKFAINPRRSATNEALR